MSFTRQDIVETARSYLGVRFARSGRDRNRGVDCVGLITCVGRDLGLDIQDVINYNFEPKPGLFMKTIKSQTEPVKAGTYPIGSIVLLRQSIFPMHAGIIAHEPGLGGRTIINANLRHRMVIEEPISNWRNEIITLRDYQGITE